jgi:hypothetical protein
MFYQHCFSSLLWNIPVGGSKRTRKDLNSMGHQLLAYADDVTIVGEITDTIKKNTEALLDASKEVALK